MVALGPLRGDALETLYGMGGEGSCKGRGGGAYQLSVPNMS